MTIAIEDAIFDRRGEHILEEQNLRRLDAYWRAANYLTVSQICLLDNPLLREPLRPEHIKPRLLGHWGPTPVSASSTCTSTASSKPAI
jgi:xylulose-5-phosphate/fructose-6-phosphate phosphoketolase